ncbi:MAG TPA: helix-turn-helix transcriptional regulator [Ktedonobacteraceae bacterium]
MPDKEEDHGARRRLNLCGIHLRRLRLEKHLTLVDIQATLELDYGMSLDRTNLGRIENGERTVTDIELAVFAHLLEIPVERLLWGEASPNAELPGDLLKNVELRYAARHPKKNNEP